MAFPQTNAPPDFKIPNDVTAGTNKQHRQSAMYDLDWELLGRPRGFGVISGCAVTQRAAGANLSVDVAGGYVDSEGTRFTVAAINVAVTALDATNPRIDVAVVDVTGVPRVRAGTAAAVPVPPALTMGDVVLAFIHLDTSGTQSTVVNADIIPHAINRDYDFSTEPTLDGLQDFFRTHGKETQRFYNTLGSRLGRPTNVAVIGDSMLEGYGVTDDTQKAQWQWREAVQQDYRDGGVGFIAARHGTTWPYLTNPDGLNTWAHTTLVDNAYYGFGLGDRAAWLSTANASTSTISFYGDRFYLHFTGGLAANALGTAQVDIDAGTAYAQTFTFNTQQLAFGMSGRVYQSPVLPQGNHSVRVTSITAASSVFLDGITTFNTDETVGVHFWDGSHSGYLSQSFDPTLSSNGTGWADIFWQPANEVVFTSAGTGHGTTTLDVTGGGFTNNDIDEILQPPSGTLLGSLSMQPGTKIVSVNSATQVVVNKVVANVGSLSLKMNRSSFADGKTNVGAVTGANGTTAINSTSISSASNPFSEASVGATITDAGAGKIQPGSTITQYVSPSTVIISQPALAAGTTAVFTITASPGLYSATAAFTPWDVGRKMKGTNIPAGAFIRQYVSPTLVYLSAPVTGTGTAQTFQINNRQKYPMQPDLIVIELGINDSKFGITSANYKAQIKRIVQNVIDRGGLDYTPSVMLVGLWATSSAFDVQDVTATTVNGFPTITSTTGDYGFYDATGTFRTDITAWPVTGTNIPGGATATATTPFLATLSANATGDVAGSLKFTGRVMQDFVWQRFRTALRELAEEQSWFFKDLYTLYGYIGNGQFATAQNPAAINTTAGADPNNFTADGTHPNNAGSRTIADALSREIGGKAKTGLVSRGLGNAKGDRIYWIAADDPRVQPASAAQPGQADRYAPSAFLGVRPVDDLQKCRVIQQVNAVPAGTTVAAFGSIATAPTITAGSTVTTNTDDEFCSRISINSAVSGTAGKILSAFTLVRRGWMPEFTAIIKTGATLTTVRYWIGLFSADPSASATPAISLAAWRFDTGAGDTTWNVVTKDGTTLNAKPTPLAPVASTIYELGVTARGTAGSAPTTYDFWVNDVAAGSLTANLPLTGLILGCGVTMTPLAASARSLELSRWTLTCV